MKPHVSVFAAFAAIVLSASTVIGVEESLFGKGPSQGELDAARQGAEASTTLLDSLATMRKLATLAQMEQGDCEPALEIEQQAKSGDMASQVFLAELHIEGLCVERSDASAAKWYQSASKGGDAEATRRLAAMYALGVGVQKNQETAARLMRESAEAGNADAMVGYATFLLNGEGVPQDRGQGIRWLERAATDGSMNARTRLGFLYLAGDDVARDSAKAYEWALPAADLGMPLAQLVTGVAAASAERLVEGHKWLNVAAASDDEKIARLARAERTTLEAKMSPSQIAEAQALASEWRPQRADDKDPTPTVSSLPAYEVGLAEQIEAKEQAARELQRLGVPITKDAFFDTVRTDNLGLFVLFLKAGASINERWGLAGATPLYLSADLGSSQVFTYLLKHGADVNQGTLGGMTPLVRAIAHHRSDMVGALLSAGASAKQDAESPQALFGGGTALQYALLGNGADPQFVERLFTAGASAKEIYENGLSTLMVAAEAPSSVFALLLSEGADPNAEDAFGESVMMHLVKSDRVSVSNLRLLLRAGARTDWSESELSPLLFSIVEGHAEAVAAILEAGAESDVSLGVPSERIPMSWQPPARKIVMNGGTPLMLAVSVGHAAVARELVSAGADPTATIELDGRAVSATSIAAESGSKLLQISLTPKTDERSSAVP